MDKYKELWEHLKISAEEADVQGLAAITPGQLLDSMLKMEEEIDEAGA